MKKPKPCRCDFCDRPSVVMMDRSASVSRMGHLRRLRWKKGACAEHQTCPAWLGLVALHPESPPYRIDAS